MIDTQRIPCDQCRFYGDERPNSEAGFGTVGHCGAVGTLHPVAYSWNSCHLANRRKAGAKRRAACQ